MPKRPDRGPRSPARIAWRAQGRRTSRRTRPPRCRVQASPVRPSAARTVVVMPVEQRLPRGSPSSPLLRRADDVAEQHRRENAVERRGVGGSSGEGTASTLIHRRIRYSPRRASIPCPGVARTALRGCARARCRPPSSSHCPPSARSDERRRLNGAGRSSRTSSRSPRRSKRERGSGLRRRDAASGHPPDHFRIVRDPRGCRLEEPLSPSPRSPSVPRCSVRHPSMSSFDDPSGSRAAHGASGPGVVEDEPEDPIRVHGGEQGGEAPSISVAEEHRSFGSGAIQHGAQVIGAHIEVAAPRPIDRTDRCRAVEQDHPGERPEPVEEPTPRRLEFDLEVARPTR